MLVEIKCHRSLVLDKILFKIRINFYFNGVICFLRVEEDFI